jgi:hypothetical protein
VLLTTAACAAEPVGTTHIARWQDDKAAAFILMFDDGLPSHVKTVVPELKKRGFTATFYINPGAGHYAGNKQAWEHDIPAAGFELANHTMTHGGVTSLDAAEREIGGCNNALQAIQPAPWPRLISWGQPGVPKEKWTISKDDLAAQLAKNHLITRPDFGGRGAMIAFQTADQMLKHVDGAIAKGSMESIVFHGVGGEWITTPVPVFLGLLDGLEQRRDKLWITNHIPAHQYATERDAATVKAKAQAKAITVELACTADPAFYNQPLTLVTTVPAAWTTCTVTQGKAQSEATAANGVLRYHALPGHDAITISPKH